MYHLKLVLEYDGSGFHGFQTQKSRSKPSIQGELERRLAEILGEPVTVRGSGRTDRGVHALDQVVAFSVNRDEIPPGGLIRMLEVGLPDSIRVRRWEVPPESFHPRAGVETKAYSYLLIFGRKIKPFYRKYVWNVPQTLDVEAMRRAAPIFVGTHDFTAFANSYREPVNTVKTIRRLRIMRIPHTSQTLALRVTGTGFLHRMVRRIVGALVDVGRGRLTADEVAAILARKRPDGGYTIAPAEGLYLARVQYSTGSDEA